MRISDWSSDVCSSDLSAYGELMRRHREPVYRLVRGHIGDADAALDVTQQSFIAAFAALARYDGARPFRVWMARIAINKCHDWTRRRAVRRLFSFALPDRKSTRLNSSH